MQEYIPFGARLTVLAKIAMRDEADFAAYECSVHDGERLPRRLHAQGVPAARPRRAAAGRPLMADTVLVTGSSRGIGRAIALRLARAGFALVVHGRAPSPALDSVVAEVAQAGATARAVHFDVVRSRRGRRGARRRHRCEWALTTASYAMRASRATARFPALSGEDWDQVLEHESDGFYNVVQPLIMPMIRRRQPGRIVTLSSVSGVTGNRGQVNYCAAKAGIIGATKALAVELASRQITVNCVAPGLIRTDMTATAPIEEALKFIPAGRVGEPEEVAGIVAFLMSREADYITRQVIGVNGGLA